MKGVILITLLMAQLAGVAQLLRKRADSALAALNTAKNDSVRVLTLSTLAEIYLDLHPDSTVILCKQAIAMAGKEKWIKILPVLHTTYGTALSRSGKFADSDKQYRQSLSIHRQLGDSIGVVGDLINLGANLANQSRHTDGLRYCLEANRLSEQIQYTGKQGLILYNIGTLYMKQENYPAAMSYNYQALDCYRKIHDQSGEARVLSQIASLLLLTNKADSARLCQNEALAYYEKAGDKTGMAIVYGELGSLSTPQELDKRIFYYLKADSMWRSLNPRHYNAFQNTGNLGYAYLEKYTQASNADKSTAETRNWLANAEKYTREAAKLSLARGDVQSHIFYLGNLAEVLFAKGDYKQAFLSFQTYHQKSDSLFSQDIKNRLADMAAQYNFEKKENIYKQQQQLDRLKLRQFWLYGIILVLLLASSLLYLIFRSRNKQIHLRRDLKMQQAEQQARDLSNHAKLIESELKAIRSQMNPHFLFNVLNSIESYILDNEPRTASQLVQKFAYLNRLILENSSQALVTAQKEWKALQLYTELEAMRYHNSFSYTFTVSPDLDLNAVSVPPMLVQPLIENGIHHGLRHDDATGKMLEVKLEQRGEMLKFTVTDNGVGLIRAKKFLTQNSSKEKSLGLLMVKERIEMINDGSSSTPASFSITDLSETGGKGTMAELVLPMFKHTGRPGL